MSSVTFCWNMIRCTLLDERVTDALRFTHVVDFVCKVDTEMLI